MIAVYPKEEIKMIKKRGFILLIKKVSLVIYKSMLCMYIGLYNLSRSTTKKKAKEMICAPSLGIRLRCPHEDTLGP